MYPRTETSLQDPSTDESRPLLHRGFGHTESDRDEDQHQPVDTVDGRAADQTQPEDQWDADEQTATDREAVDDESRDGVARLDEQPDDAVADDMPQSERPMDDEGDLRRDDATDDAPHGDPEPAAFGDPTDLKPGDAPAAAVTAIWSDDSARDLRDRWREAQLSFVDDPQKAADDIRTLVSETVEALTSALASHHEQLNSWPDNRDTEQYRMVVQRYRAFFERLMAV
jgi:hypothetical protein